MKLLLENWREYLNEEQLLVEQIERDFVLLAESLTEYHNKGLLLEGVAREFIDKVREFGRWKNEKLASWIKPALEKLYHLSIRLRRAGKIPFILGKKIRNLITDLMKPDNLVLAASIISIIAGLLMGDVVTNAGAISDLLQAVEAAPALVDAAANFASASDVKDALEATVKGAKLTRGIT